VYVPPPPFADEAGAAPLLELLGLLEQADRAATTAALVAMATPIVLNLRDTCTVIPL
jgi:hypothetical protein